MFSFFLFEDRERRSRSVTPKNFSLLNPFPSSLNSQNPAKRKQKYHSQSAFVGAMAIADLVKSTLGPKGMDKILQSVGRGHGVTVTNDGATILRSIYVDNPAAKVLVDISRVQDEEVGDGTTSVVVLAGELLREAEKLVREFLVCFPPFSTSSGGRPIFFFFFFFFCLLLLSFFTRLLPTVCCRFLPLEFFHPALFFGEPERAKEEAKRETKPDGKLSLTPFPPFKKNKKRLKNVSNFFSSFKQIAAKVHPMTIIAGFRAAAAVAEASLSSGAIDHAKESPASFRDSLLRVARTTLSSKILTNDRDHFAELAVSAVLRLQRPEDGVSPPALDAVHVLKKAGGALADSFLDEGFILDKAIGVGQPRRVENAKILVANTAMDTDKVKIYGARVRVDSMAKVAELEAAERDKMREKVRRKLFFFLKVEKSVRFKVDMIFVSTPPPKKNQNQK